MMAYEATANYMVLPGLVLGVSVVLGALPSCAPSSHRLPLYLKKNKCTGGGGLDAQPPSVYPSPSVFLRCFGKAPRNARLFYSGGVLLIALRGS